MVSVRRRKVELDEDIGDVLLHGALYLAVAGLLGLALGALLRSTAGGIAALSGLLFAVPILVGFLPGSLSDEIGIASQGPPTRSRP